MSLLVKARARNAVPVQLAFATPVPRGTRRKGRRSALDAPLATLRTGITWAVLLVVLAVLLVVALGVALAVVCLAVALDVEGVHENVINAVDSIR